jgi:hypothetical protein
VRSDPYRRGRELSSKIGASPMISSQQHRKLMRSYQQTENLSTSALRGGVDRKPARKYAIEGSLGPEEPRSARPWRTRPDAFAEVWPQVEEELRREPELEAKVLFELIWARKLGQVNWVDWGLGFW